MDSFLRKYRLIDTLSFKLNCDKASFIEKFRANVEPSDLSFNPLEVFSSGSKLYKGKIQNSTFEIQKKKQLFNSKQQSSIASAKITEGINDIKVDMEINGVTPFIKVFYIFIAVFYLLFLLGFGFFYFSSSDFPLFVFPLILFHACFMIGIPFFVMKSSVKNFKLEIEREFHFWIK